MPWLWIFIKRIQNDPDIELRDFSDFSNDKEFRKYILKVLTAFFLSITLIIGIPFYIESKQEKKKAINDYLDKDSLSECIVSEYNNNQIILKQSEEKNSNHPHYIDVLTGSKYGQIGECNDIDTNKINIGNAKNIINYLTEEEILKAINNELTKEDIQKIVNRILYPNFEEQEKDNTLALRP